MNKKIYIISFILISTVSQCSYGAQVGDLWDHKLVQTAQSFGSKAYKGVYDSFSFLAGLVSGSAKATRKGIVGFSGSVKEKGVTESLSTGYEEFTKEFNDSFLEPYEWPNSRPRQAAKGVYDSFSFLARLVSGSAKATCKGIVGFSGSVKEKGVTESLSTGYEEFSKEFDDNFLKPYEWSNSRPRQAAKGVYDSFSFLAGLVSGSAKATRKGIVGFSGSVNQKGVTESLGTGYEEFTKEFNNNFLKPYDWSNSRPGQAAKWLSESLLAWVLSGTAKSTRKGIGGFSGSVKEKGVTESLGTAYEEFSKELNDHFLEPYDWKNSKPAVWYAGKGIGSVGKGVWSVGAGIWGCGAGAIGAVKAIGKGVSETSDSINQKGISGTVDAAYGQLSKKLVGEASKEFNDKVLDPFITELEGKSKVTLKEFEDKSKEALTSFEEKSKAALLLGSALFVGCVTSYYILKFISDQVVGSMSRPRLLYTKLTFDSNDFMMRSGFRDMVFSAELKSRLNSLLISTEMMTRKQAFGQGDCLFRNIVFSGAHGLGKHMFAQELARFAGMDFYEIKSSSLVKFKNDEAEIALSDFFREVNRTYNRRPAIIYIDNASVLFSKYVSDNPSDIGRMIRVFVEKTERRSNKFMLILGITERPGFDNDMSSVIDDIVEFKFPELEERIKIMEIYRDKLFLTAKDVKPAFAAVALDCLHDTKIREVADQLKNFSVADIVSFMKALKAESQLPYEGAISESIITRVLERTVLKYKNNLIA